MKNRLLILSGFLLLLPYLFFAQELHKKHEPPLKQGRVTVIAGIGLSIPVHDDLLKTHLLGLDAGARLAKPITAVSDVGISVIYEYHIVRRNIRDSTFKSIMGHRNFSVIGLKPGMQFYLPAGWYFGAESGPGFVILDGDSKTGFGFVEEYHGHAQFGLASSMRFGKFFTSGKGKRSMALSINWSNFFAKDHAENFAGLNLSYCLTKRSPSPGK